MEVAIGEYGTDVDVLAEAAENRCKQVDTKTSSSETGRQRSLIARFDFAVELSKPINQRSLRVTFSNILL